MLDICCSKYSDGTVIWADYADYLSSKLSFIVKLQNIGYNIVKYLNKSASSLSRYVS